MVAASAAPRAQVVPGRRDAEFLRTSRAFRNPFRRAAGSNVGLAPSGRGRTDVRRSRLQRCCETRAIAPATHTPLRTTARTRSAAAPGRPGAESLRSSCAFRNLFRRAAGSNVGLPTPGRGRTDVRRRRLQRCCGKHAMPPSIQTRLRMTTRAEDRQPPPFPLGDAVRRPAATQASSGRGRAPPPLARIRLRLRMLLTNEEPRPAPWQNARQRPSPPPARPACRSRVVGHRAKIWLATISTVVGVATGMFTLRDQVFPSEAGSAGAMSASAYEEHVGRLCDELNANDRLRAHEDSKLRIGLLGAKTTLDQRNLLLDAVRRTTARDGHTLASFTGLAAPKALASVRHDTQHGLEPQPRAGSRLCGPPRRRRHASRAPRRARPPLDAATVARRRRRSARGGPRTSGRGGVRPAPPKVTQVITLPCGHEPVNTAAAPSPNQRKNGANTPRPRSGRRGAHIVRRGAGNLGLGRNPPTGSARRGTYSANTPGRQAAVRG